ncbi:MAG: branched-chain amino acid transport system permease protein [Thermosediminibacterales bacterium]|nr:branched-chain amino acid transport system permease protein [Thermosediminibacterales bacterium]MDK2836536.1 branched-chain amino acid transport system permease protein [Thermosediminibacterales bacterium]
MIEFFQVLVSGIMLGGIYSLISIGLTLIFGIMRILNFAHGEYLMIAMYLSFWLFKLLNIDPYVSIIIVVPALFLLGIISQKLVIKPIINAPPTMQIFATVGLSLVFQNLALFLWKADYRTVKTSYQTATIHLGPMLVSFPRMVAFLIAIIVSLGFFYFLKNTYTGKALRSIAQNREAAMLMGIDVSKMYMIAFALGTACVGVAGALLMPVYYVFPTVGTYFGVTAFVVVVLGGMGNMTGAFLGGLLIGVIESISGVYIDPSLKEAVYFIIFILVLLFKPSGLFGLRGAEEVGLK